MTITCLAISMILGGEPTTGIPLFRAAEQRTGTVILLSNAREVYSVAPYGFYAAPYSNRPNLIELTLVKPNQKDRLPNAFVATTSELVGSATVVLPLVKMDPKDPTKVVEKKLVTLRLK